MQTANGAAESSELVVAESVGALGHHVPEQWLRARVRGWMELHESPGFDYWIGTYTEGGRWIHCSSNGDRWAPSQSKQQYAMDVCRNLNAQLSSGGAWLAGWTLDGRCFYLLWKDADGDIQIPIECEKPFISIRDWKPSVWETHATAALGVWSEWHKNQEYGKGQQVKLAQGDKVSPNHLSEGLPVAGLT